MQKKNVDIDKQKANKYFKKSLSMLDKLKNSENISQIIQTTEAECKKYININRKNLFALVSKSNIEEIKKIKNINFDEINENGNTILHHSVKIGDIQIIKELLKKGGKIDQVNGNGHTLLEYACLNKDPNIINILLGHGANMKKHLFFRKGCNKFYLNKSDIDIAILLKLIIANSLKKNINTSSTIISLKETNKFIFLKKYFNIEELVGIETFTMENIIIGLDCLFNNKLSYDTYKSIIIEDLEEYEESIRKIGKKKCTYSKLDIVLINLIPFINYPFNIGCDFIIKKEIKYLIKNILKHNKKNYKNLLMNKLFDIYIKNKLFTEDYIGILVYQIMSKIKL